MRAVIWMGMAAVLGVAMAGGAGAQEVTLKRVGAAGARAAAFERIEWIVEGVGSHANPFDPAEVSVDGEFSGPGGRRMVLPAFWNQEFRNEAKPGERERLVADGAPHWRLRFAAPAAGAWQVRVLVKDKAGVRRSAAMTVNVDEPRRGGFVRRPAGSRYFELASGQPYFIVGLNVAWPGRGGLASYERWFKKLSEAGGNFARIWMTDPNRPIDTREAGAGRYDLGACAYYDRVLELAERNNLYCMLALGAAGDLFDGGYFNEGRWHANPYNAANGGPATRPADLFENPANHGLYQRRLRYLIGRYSAYASLGFWELWNEQDNARFSIKADWVKTMAGYLKANDPYGRPVTTSYSNLGDAAVWSLEEIDLTQRHMYGDEEGMLDAAPILAANTLAHARFQKPHLIGEYGISWRGADGRIDPERVGTNLHNALWAGAMSGGAGGACNWWWDSYVEPGNLYHRFTGLSRFAAAVDWPRRRFEPIRVMSPTSRAQGPETFADATFPASNAWGRSEGKLLAVEKDGSLSGMLPGFLYGPEKKEMRTRTRIEVDLPRPTRMTMRVLKVSDHATLRVFIDDAPKVDFAFSALPGATDQEKSEASKEHKHLHQAVFNKDRTVEIPAGKHIIGLDLVGGDWLTIGSITLHEARSSRYTGLRVMALQDRASGESLLWLQDPASHTGSDRTHRPMAEWKDAVVALPVAADGAYRADWWDTRLGRIVRSEAVEVEGGSAAITVPAFTRDIALRVTRAAQASRN